MEWTDSEVVDRVRTGDRDAFRLLVERHSRGLFRLAYRMVGNDQDAEDVVQESFLRAYKQLHQFDRDASFYTWLYRIAANYSLDLIRVRKRHGSQEQVDGETFQAQSVDPLPDRLAMGSQLQVQLEAALGLLSPQERTAFVLRHFEGQSIQEIGDTLGTSGNATKQSIFRAVQKLRRCLEPFMTAAS
jgi:RNA polymerase sigma-70 factor (ECF subfamily)